MNKNLKEQHRLEWDIFFTNRSDALNKLHDDEQLILKQFMNQGEGLPDDWEEKINRDRDNWMMDWGIQGRHAKAIEERQKQETALQEQTIREESDIRLLDLHTGKQIHEMGRHSRDTGTQLQFNLDGNNPPNLHEEPVSEGTRKSKWDELFEEQEAIRYHYAIEKEYIPLATQRRMAMQVDVFRQKWENAPTEATNTDWETLSPKELENEFQTWRDLADQHKVIEELYRYEANIPEATVDRMKDDIRQYWKEMDRYKARLSQSSKQVATIEDFRNSLQETKARQQTKRQSFGPS